MDNKVKQFIYTHRLEIYLGILVLIIMSINYPGLFTTPGELLPRASPDAKNYWKPAAESAISGEGPYTGSRSVKPPLFIFLIIVAEFVGFVPFLTLVVLISNIVIVFSISDWLEEIGIRPNARAIATLVTASGIIMMHYFKWNINNKAISVAILLFVLQFEDDLKLGAGIALAGLFAQQIVVALPAVIWYRIHNKYDFFKLSAGGILTVIISYLFVAMIWGVGEGIISARRSLLMPVSGYIWGTSSFGRQLTLWNNPGVW